MDSIVEIEAALAEGHSAVLAMLHGVIYDCGGWILKRGRLESGLVRFVFEFPRDICVEIYSALVSLGLDLTPSSHRILTELCRCTPYLFDLPSLTVAAVDEASLDEATRYVCSLEIVKVNLYIRFANQETLGSGSSGAA